MGRDARAKYDGLRNFDDDRPRNSIDRQVADARWAFIAQLEAIAAEADQWAPAERSALRDAAQRLANAAQ